MAKTDAPDFMEYDALKQLRDFHPAWRLMASGNAVFAISFFYNEFIAENRREIPEYELIHQLENLIERTADRQDISKSAKDYLTEWASDQSGWLRRFYPPASDEVHCDLTSDAVRAIDWVLSLKPESFIGTESRLLMVFDLFHQITQRSETKPEVRIMELERQKKELDKEIEEIKQGNIKVLGSTQIVERFNQAMSMSKEILSDFRAVEHNFRVLNKEMRERIISWDKSKGELIGSYFADQNNIYKSEQGRSFEAFFEFLMSSNTQSDLEQTIEQLKEISDLKETINDSGIDHIQDDWLSGSRYVWSVVEMMSEQLRRYVDENYLEEERRIGQLIKDIEAKAIQCAEYPPKGTFSYIDESRANIKLPAERTLYKIPVEMDLIDEEIEIGQLTQSDEALYSHVFIDKEQLNQQIMNMLEEKAIVTLKEVITKYPIKYGLTELLAYYALETTDSIKVINDTLTEPISWSNSVGKTVVATMPEITFQRRETK